MESGAGVKFHTLSPGSFSFRLNVPVTRDNRIKINMPIYTVVMSKIGKTGELPILLEAKSAGDYTNTNKRRKEEATKFRIGYWCICLRICTSFFTVANR
jgi:hypothetical protein